VRVNVTGAADARRVAAGFGAAAKAIKREYDRASREAGDIISTEVKAHNAEYIPMHFEMRWGQSFHAKTEIKTSGQVRHVSVVFYAIGKRNRRRIVQINQGRLRHPVHGRNRRLKDGSLQANPWVEQRIRPGLVDEPAQRAMPRAVAKFAEATRRFVNEIGR